MAGLAKRIEGLARRLGRTGSRIEPRSPLEKVALEMGIVGERLETLRARHHARSRRLLEQEASIRTELNQLVSYRPRIYVHKASIRQKMRGQLIELERERHNLIERHEKETSELQDRLAKLVSQHGALAGG